MFYFLPSNFFFNSTAPTDIYTLSLHDALPICLSRPDGHRGAIRASGGSRAPAGLSVRQRPAIGADDRQLLALRSEEHTSELQSLRHLVCRLLLEKKKKEK